MVKKLNLHLLFHSNKASRDLVGILKGMIFNAIAYLGKVMEDGP